tara:strand:+ start:1643 stop:1825 length:183 start_codon:yes stop_codon:yes gene_type:complete
MGSDRMEIIAKELFDEAINDDDEVISKLIEDGAIFYCSHSGALATDLWQSITLNPGAHPA